jgi:hypothetical protein
LSKEVDDYIQKQKSPQREICQALRQIILQQFPGIREEMKLGVPYYEDKYYIVALKNCVNLGFSLKGLSLKEIKLFEGGGKTTKHIKVRSLAEIDKPRIVQLLEMVNERRK